MLGFQKNPKKNIFLARKTRRTKRSRIETTMRSRSITRETPTDASCILSICSLIKVSRVKSKNYWLKIPIDTVFQFRISVLFVWTVDHSSLASAWNNIIQLNLKNEGSSSKEIHNICQQSACLFEKNNNGSKFCQARWPNCHHLQSRMRWGWRPWLLPMIQVENLDVSTAMHGRELKSWRD